MSDAFLKNPCGLVNLPPGPFVYQMWATEIPNNYGRISASEKRIRDHDGT